MSRQASPSSLSRRIAELGAERERHVQAMEAIDRKLRQASIAARAESRFDQEGRGRKFGRLTPLRRHDGRHWECDCDCGKTVVVERYKVLHGKVLSCGCQREESWRKPRLKRQRDISGLRFGRLVARERVGKNAAGIAGPQA